MAERQDTGGLATVLALLGARGGIDGGDDQAGLFEAEDAALPLPTKGASGPQGGRPLNARNKSTDAWARYLLSQHKSPLTVLAQLYSRPTGELVDELQAMADKHVRVRVAETGTEHVVGAVRIDPLQVLKLQRDAAVALAPYVHKQQPKAVEISEKPRGVLIMGDLAGGEGDGAEAEDAVMIPLAPIEQKQQVSATFASKSDKPQSDTAGFASDNNPLAYNGD